jgi:hypothetical protein
LQLHLCKTDPHERMLKGSEDENVDLHYQMCKKIAQLAKVIYHLHSKNEDHEYEIRDLTSAYEEQIEEVKYKL